MAIGSSPGRDLFEYFSDRSHNGRITFSCVDNDERALQYLKALCKVHLSKLALLMNLRIPIAGSWSYNDREQILQLDITATFMQQRQHDVVIIYTTGEESGYIHGRTSGGLPWRLRRIS